MTHSSNKNFYKFLFIFAIYNLANWMLIGLIPLVVSQYFGNKGEFILAIGIRILPKILFGKFISKFLYFKNPIMTLAFCSIILSIINAILPFLFNYLFFLIVLFVIGAIDICIVPTLLLLRSILIQDNNRIIENLYYQLIERLSKIIGPLIVLIILLFYKIEICFLLISILLIVFCFFLTLLNIPVLYTIQSQNYKKIKVENAINSFRCYEFILSTFSNTSILHLLVIPAIGYLIMLGALNPFLFWSNIETFGNLDKKWIYFILAQGIGALIGTLVIIYIQKKVFFKQKILNIYLWTNLIEGILHLFLAWTLEFNLALIILTISGIPEMIATIIYYTIIQKAILKNYEYSFYTFSVILLDSAYFIGIVLSEIYILGFLSLQNYWITVTSLSILTVIPFFWILPSNYINKNCNFKLNLLNMHDN